MGGPIRSIAELGLYLASGLPSLDKVSRFLVFRTIVDGKPKAAQILLIDSQGEIYVSASFGHVPQLKPINLVESNSLLSECVLENKVCEISSSDKIMVTCLETMGIAGEELICPFKSALAVPIYIRGVLILYFDEPFLPTDMEKNYLLAVGTLLAIHVSRLFEASVSPNLDIRKNREIVYGVDALEDRSRVTEKLENRILTNRQEVILEGLKHGRSNKEIAENLDFSESLIRQETIQIYRKLGVTGRKQLTS